MTELYSALPTVELLERGRCGGGMRRWEREQSGPAKLAPAAAMAGYVYRYAERG
jgi:hypothetical protein